MSRVTDVILTIGCGDARRMDNAAALNEWLEEGSHGGHLCRVDQHAGGSKALQAGVYIGGCNYLQIKGFIEKIRSLEWERPECVRLFVQEEHDEEGFTERAVVDRAPGPLT